MDDTSDQTTSLLRERWSAGDPAIGVWSTVADPVTAELLARAGFDYLCVDMQHGFADDRSLVGLLQAVEATPAASLVRLGWKHPAAVMRALDAGADGVVVPMVDDADEARSAVSACRYPPRGTRSWGPMRAAVSGRPFTTDGANDEVVCVVMIETAGALEHLDEIAAVPGIDALYVGPHDLALSLGHGRATYRDNTAMRDHLDRVVAACTAHGLVAGLHCSDVEMAVEWRQRGMRLLTVATDTALLTAAATATAAAVGRGADT